MGTPPRALGTRSTLPRRAWTSKTVCGPIGLEESAVRILYFHTLRQAAGCSEEPGPDGVDHVKDLLAWAAERHPALGAHLSTILVARNHEWVERDASLSANDEVALMPPVSGG